MDADEIESAEKDIMFSTRYAAWLYTKETYLGGGTQTNLTGEAGKARAEWLHAYHNCVTEYL